MLNIIDNAGLSSRTDPTVNPWLERILNHAKGLSEDNFLIRLTSERKPSSIIYTLENSRNKTLAYVSKKSSVIRVETFRRELPDPERFIKPPMAPVSATLHDDTPQGLVEAAQALHAVLGCPTPYSSKKVLKAKVHSVPDNEDPWALCGGRITGVAHHGDNALEVQLEHGGRHALSASSFFGKVMPRLCKYLVLDSRGNAEVINDSEFDFYFQHTPSCTPLTH